jgi:hypothetical protein
MARNRSSSKNNSTANLGFDAKLWLAGDKLRSNMDTAEYKHVVLGLIFLKYISDAFEEKHAQLLKEPGADPEDQDEYKAENVFWVPPGARWTYLQNSAKQPEIGKIVDDAMVAIERDNPRLKGVLPKEYARPALDKHRLGELIDLIGTISFTVGAGVSPADADETAADDSRRYNKSKDILGRVYEYFLGMFASAEGKKGGQFYTPQSVVRRLAEMPFKHPYNGENVRVCRVEAISGLEQWSERDERHARSSREGSGERVGRRANESFAEAQPRALIQMATGAGKTLTACAFTYRLIKHAGARNVLFLVDRANLGRQAMAEFQQFVTPDGRKFTELYNGASGKRCDMDGKPEGAIRGDESINVQHLTSNKLDGVCRVTICTIQRLYAMLRFSISWLNKRSRRANSHEETGNASCAFNDAFGCAPLMPVIA